MRIYLILIISVCISIVTLGCDPEHKLLDPELTNEKPEGNGGGGDESVGQGVDEEEKDIDKDIGIQPNWASIYSNLIEPVCLKCHSTRDGRKPAEGIDLSTYQKMNDSFSIFPVIFAGKPELSGLYLSIADGSMPDKGPPVDSDTVEVVRQWILNGAKETEDDTPSEDAE